MAQSDSDFECPPTTGVKQKQEPKVRKGRVKKCARKNTNFVPRHLRLPRRGEGGTAFDVSFECVSLFVWVYIVYVYIVFRV